MSPLKHAAYMQFTGTRKARINGRKNRPNSRAGNRLFCCIVCNQYPEMYMVENAVWEAAGLDKNEMCCLDCLGKLLDRPVQITDLTTAPINAGYARFFMAGYREANAPRTEENSNGNRS